MAGGLIWIYGSGVAPDNLFCTGLLKLPFEGANLMHRLIVLIAFVVAVEYLAYQAVAIGSPRLLPQAYWVMRALFWTVTAGTLLMIILWMRGVLQRWSKRTLVLLRTYVFIFFLAKLLSAAVVFLELIRQLFARLINAIAGTSYIENFYLPMIYGALGAGAIAVIVLTYGMIRNPHRYRVRHVDLKIPDLHRDLNGLSIVQLSDIHCGSFLSERGVQKGIEMARSLDPDLVLFSGDLVNNEAAEADPFIELFATIEATLGKYSICGNHDYGDYVSWRTREDKERNFNTLRQQHERIGWELLLNSHAVVEVGDARLGIIGVENYSAHPRFQKYGDLAKAIENMPEVDYCILLSHDPSHWSAEVTGQYGHIGLTLSGHTHGFQFGIDLGERFRWSPIKYVYKQWIDLYRKGKQYLYVNRGFGFLGYPGRIGILPEIAYITLTGSHGE
jgi:predicted MPP superfamily phosphohydrolase